MKPTPFNLRALQFNPIIVREVRVQMRGMRPYAILTALLLTLVGAGYAIYLLMLRQANLGATVLSAQVGQALFAGLALCELALVVFLAPALTSSAVSGEREQLTYDMLMATPLRPARILWGKLVGALSYIFLLVVATVPVFSAVLLFGGVAPLAMLKALALLIAAAVMFGTVGMFCSALFRRTSRATVVAYAAIMVVIGGLYLTSMLWGQLSTPPGQPPPPWLLYLNPFSALISIVTITPPSEGAFFAFVGDPYGILPFSYLLSQGVITFTPNGPLVLPIYRATLLFYPIAIVGLCWISAHLVLPRRRWRLRWSDLGFLLLLGGMLALTWYLRDWWYVLPPNLNPGFPQPAG